MRFLNALTSASFAAAGIVSASPAAAKENQLTFDTAKSVADFQTLAIQALKQQDAANQRRGLGSCTMKNARVRRDWQKLSKCERKHYIKAVKCLWALPAVDREFSAAQNYYDEFVAIHANLTTTIHGTGNFFTWHRYIIYLWEETLRNKCGYKAALPYWNWYEFQDDLTKSAMFDGSETSFGSTGEYFKHNGSLVGSRTIWLPPGEGGGCVKDGPFVGYTINIGPIRPAMDNYLPWMTDQRDYNPRCQRRDLVKTASQRYTWDSFYNLMAGPYSGNIGDFQDEFQRVRTLSLHGAGHYAMGGDGSDVFTSLNDPAFYQHHAMVDRIYWMWQALHPAEANKVMGTHTLDNNPPSAETTEDELLNVGVLGPKREIRELFDTMSGSPLCYYYE